MRCDDVSKVCAFFLVFSVKIFDLYGVLAVVFLCLMVFFCAPLDFFFRSYQWENSACGSRICLQRLCWDHVM